MVTALDDAVGKIVTSLKKNKMYKNTFIMFTADVSSMLEYYLSMKSATELAAPISCKQFFGLKFSFE